VAKIMTKKEYVDNDGALCPKCRSRNVVGTGDAASADEVTAWSALRCTECGSRWESFYSLAGFGFFDDGETGESIDDPA